MQDIHLQIIIRNRRVACSKLINAGLLKTNPLSSQVAAISVGMISSEPIVDLTYMELADSLER